MLTVFTTCKPFVGLTAIRQYNALQSWTLLKPDCEIIVLGNESGVAEACQSMGLRHIPFTTRDSQGLPLLDFVFAYAESAAYYDLIAYVNADIVVVGDLPWALTRCEARWPDGFLAVCRRWDVPLDDPIHFRESWRRRVGSLVEGHGSLYSPCSSDLFGWKRPLPWRMKSFSAGRGRWDNWMLAMAVQERIPVVDITQAVTIAHPHHPGSGHERKALDKDPSGQRNARLAGEMVYCLKHVGQAGLLWEMGEREIKEVG